MQADAQRNVNQQQRIHNGIGNGSLTNHEAARMEGGQARSDRVGWREQGRIRRGDNHNSHRIYRQKHDRQHRH